MAEGERNPEEQFAIHINAAMAQAVEAGADADTVARICLNTARELYDHYGAGDSHANYLEFVTDAQFEQAEIDALLDEFDGP
jgi:hypothetical protein